MSELTKNLLHELTTTMEKVVGDEGQTADLMASIIRVLDMPEESFGILAPGIIQAYQQSLNNPNDKLALVQALNASGTKVEDIINSFDELFVEIDEMSISRQKRDFLKELVTSITNTISNTEGIAKRYISIPIEFCHAEARIPQYAHISDSGMDVYALEDITINPGETLLVSTGIKVALPVGFELQVRPKSGRALKTKLRVANTPGTIDQGYRDEIKIIIENVEPPIKDITYEPVFDIETGKVDHLNITSIEYGSSYTIGKGEKFCQLVLCEVPKAIFYQVDNIGKIGDDRGGGFGSTSIYDQADPRYGTDII